MDPVLICGFCGGDQHQVRALVMGPHLGVCDGCVARLAEIRAESLALDDPAATPDSPGARAPFPCAFCGDAPARGLMVASHPPDGLPALPAICPPCLELAQEALAARA